VTEQRGGRRGPRRARSVEGSLRTGGQREVALVHPVDAVPGRLHDALVLGHDRRERVVADVVVLHQRARAAPVHVHADVLVPCDAVRLDHDVGPVLEKCPIINTK